LAELIVKLLEFALSMVSLPCRRLTPGERARVAKWS